MRTSIKFATLTSVLALGVGVATAPASADVFVQGTVTKDKNVLVTVDTTKFKNVTIDSDFNENLTSAAEAFAINNQVTSNNIVERSNRGPTGDEAPFLIDLRATLDESVRNNQGVLGLNQDVGNVNNQANVVSTAVIQQDGDAASSFTHSEAATEQRNNGSTEEQIGNIPIDISDPDKVAAVRNSVNNNSGIVGINQSTGNGINQSNNIAVAAGIGSVLALSEADLGQENTGNVVEEVNTVKRDVIRASVNGNQGVVSGNQSSGNFNNQANTVAFSALTSAATVNVPGTGGGGG